MNNYLVKESGHKAFENVFGKIENVFDKDLDC